MKTITQFLVRESNGREKVYVGHSISEIETLFNVRVLAVLPTVADTDYQTQYSRDFAAAADADRAQGWSTD